MMKFAIKLKTFASVLAACSFIFSTTFAEDHLPPENPDVEIAVDDTETNQPWLNNKSNFYPPMSKEIEEQIALQQEEQARTEEALTEEEILGSSEKNKSSILTKGYEEDLTIPSNAYPGIHHFWVNCPTDWSWFQLEDESVWHIAPEDRLKIQNWFAGYALVIRPNNWWDSNPYYPFQLYNTVTKETVQVNIDAAYGPLLNGRYSRYIYGFIDNGKEVQLTDGSVWTIKPAERRAMSRWISGDAAYVGINNDWFTGRYEYVLINTAAGNWVRADWKY